MQYLNSVRQRVLEGITATPIVANVLSGDADKQAYARYLTNVWHYAQHSSIVIGLAGSRCVAEHPELVEEVNADGDRLLSTVLSYANFPGEVLELRSESRIDS